MARARVYEVSGSDIVTPEGWRYASRASRTRRARPNQAVDVLPSLEEAATIRKRFYGRVAHEQRDLPITWPRFVRYVGVTNAEQYMSDKKLADWKPELFKHIAEDPQYLFINDQITTLLNDKGHPVEFRETGRRMLPPEGGKNPSVFYTKGYEIAGPMPQHVAVLAEDRGVQWVSSDGRYWEMRLPDCTLAAAEVPAISRRGKRSVVLLGYSSEGVHYIITGTKLGVTEDGIVH